MLVSFWSPKGGSGTSVVVAAAGLVLARRGSARIVDLDGDQAAVLALAHEPRPGIHEWLRAGPQAPTEALDHLAVDVAPRLSLLPAGDVDADGAGGESALAAAGAALAVALDSDVRPTVCDLGRLDTPASRAFAEVAGPNIVVVRGCYLALRRALRHPALGGAVGVVLVDEHGRSLGARDVEDVLGIPVVATVPGKTAIARVVDAGVLTARLPDALARPLGHAIARQGWFADEESAA